MQWGGSFRGFRETYLERGRGTGALIHTWPSSKNLGGVNFQKIPDPLNEKGLPVDFLALL